jgi:cysteine desulfurase
VNTPPIYLDYNATTSIDPAVVEAMLPYLKTGFGNPSSSHSYGKEAHNAVDRARQQVAELIGAQSDEIVFTGGGTEASNQAIKGVFFATFQGVLGRLFRKDVHVITTAVEHPATLQPCEFIRRMGARLTILPVDQFGAVDPEAVRRAITGKTRLITVMHSNNEVGTLQPIREITAVAREHGILVHTDAAQSMGKLPVGVNELGVDLLTIAGHKLYAPKGVGVLYVRRGTKLEPFIHGAGHESGRRAGTENVPYLVALGTACTLARQSLPSATERLRSLRNRLWEGLKAALGERIVLNGHPENRLPNTLNANFVGHVGADFLASIPEIAASTGSACHEGLITQSPVLCAMGVPPEIGRGAVRLSVGRFTTEDEIDRAVTVLVQAAQKSPASP